MAKVTLISVNDVVYELGIRSLAAYLKLHGHSVQLIFLNEPSRLLSADCLWDVMRLAEGSALVGVSLLTHSLQKAITVTRFLRVHHPAIPVVWGGIHATGFPEACLEYADAVCLGEGEETILELVERLAGRRAWDDVANLCLRAPDGRIVRNAVRPLIQDIDSLPFQDYSLENDHVTEDGRLVRLTDEKLRCRTLFYSFAGMGPVYVTMTSRGCPFNCTFCCNDVLRSLYRHQRPYVRKRSVANVISELEAVTARHPFFRSVLLEDDSFLFRKVEEIREFAALYTARIGLPFGIEMNPNEVSEDKLRLLKDAGLTLVHVGIQSGSGEVRKRYYNRSTSDAAIYETNRILTQLRVLHKYDIIIDTPFEGDGDASLHMLRRFKPFFAVNLYSLRVYPGLALERVMREGGFQEWLAANDSQVSYNQILSQDPCAFVLKLYTRFPPTQESWLRARALGHPLIYPLLRRLLASWTCRHVLARWFGVA